MSQGLQLAFTADLHWGHGARGSEANALLVDYLHRRPPDVLVLAGDIGTGHNFDACLAALADLPGLKALVPGNHDIWVHPDAALDSLALYEEDLPRRAAAFGFHYLDHGPLYLPGVDLALVGSINWYDYSWSLEALQQHHPLELHRLQSKRFTRGRHNDANYVRWPLDDVQFTSRVVSRLADHLAEALAWVGRVLAVTHHPPCYALSFPRPAPSLALDALLWDALCGNQAMEDLLSRHAGQIPYLFCGHTHREREATLAEIRGHNIGGDYHYKRLLWLDWDAQQLEAHIFGNPER